MTTALPDRSAKVGHDSRPRARSCRCGGRAGSAAARGADPDVGAVLGRLGVGRRGDTDPDREPPQGPAPTRLNAGELGLARAYVTGSSTSKATCMRALSPVSCRRPRGAPRSTRTGRGWPAPCCASAPSAAPPAAPRGGPSGRIRHTFGPRPKRHQSPLRRRQRLLPRWCWALMVYSCAYWAEPTARWRRPARQARPDLPQARPAARACGCSTSAAAGAPWPARGPRVRRAGSASPSPRSRPTTPASGSPRTGSPTWSRSACRTTATHDGPFDAIASSAWPSTSAPCRYREYAARLYALLSPAAGCSTTRSRAAPARRVRPHPTHFIDAYVFPDGELGRWAARRRPGGGRLRGARRRSRPPRGPGRGWPAAAAPRPGRRTA